MRALYADGRKMETSTNDENFLEVKQLSIQYHAGGEIVEAVNDVSFSLKRGKTLGLVGETGAGKTTIAKAIMRILPDPPAKVMGGEIWFHGKDLLGMPEKQVRKIRGEEISMIFQDPMTALNPVFTVGSQIAEVIKTHEKISKKESDRRAGDLLEMVGIPRERFHEYPHQFSGGMKQRVVIAMALACNPKLLIADEPTTALDVTIQAQVLDLMNKLREKFDTAMIMITHDLGVVAEICDEVAVIYAGEVVESGSREDIFDRPIHPYTNGLFGALPSLVKEQRRLEAIHGMTPDPTDLPSGCRFHPRCPYATESCAQEARELREIAPGHLTRCTGKSREGNG